jgi:hypothetical protein
MIKHIHGSRSCTTGTQHNAPRQPLVQRRLGNVPTRSMLQDFRSHPLCVALSLAGFRADSPPLAK